MVMIDTMDDLVARGVTIFDMGIGGYPSNAGSVANLSALIAVSRIGQAHVLADSLKRTIRKNPTLLAIAQRIKILAGMGRCVYPRG
jgi:hypothetical protein